HPHSPAADAAAGTVAGATREAYAEAVSRSPSYARWLGAHPRFGTVA
ncbi:LysR family transcriptional regulator, partial [Streptomyces sp. SID7982]|nr:LysR family transcriptional regulator [Streptomyces sp. SID7982]